MRKIKTTIIFILLIILVLSLYGCSGNPLNDLKSKTVQELEYLDTEIVELIDELSGISSENYIVASRQAAIGKTSQNLIEVNNIDDSKSDTNSDNANDTITVMNMVPDTILAADSNDIDWASIESQIEEVHSSWSVILLDLYSLNVNGSNILAFGNTLDSCIISIKDKNKKDSLTNLAKLYSYIPMYLKDIPGESTTQNIKLTKSYILSSYSLVYQADWTDAAAGMASADAAFKNVQTDIDYIKNKEYQVNKTYVLLKDLQKSVALKDDKVFYMKYQNTMESLNSM